MIPDQVLQWAHAAQAQTGVSNLAAAGAVAVARPESRYNPQAIGDNNTSYGLTQLHQGGGLGDGYAVSTLLDPVQNLAIAMSNIQASLNANGGNLYAALQPWSTRDLAWRDVPGVMQSLGDSSSTSAGALPIAPPAFGAAPGSPFPVAALVIAALVAAFVLVS